MAVHDMLMAAAGGTAGAVNYIDDVFSTYLYTGNGSTQTITNGIDLSTKGGMAWTKVRNVAEEYHSLYDTVRGTGKYLSTNTTNAQQVNPVGISAFNSDGFTLGSGNPQFNGSGYNYVSWTFRKQPKFFDVVTYTGNGAGSRNIAHSLASKPGFIAIKCTSHASNWIVWARVDDSTVAVCQNQLSSGTFGFDNTRGAPTVTNSLFVNAATSTTFDPYWVIGGIDTQVNESGKTYVAYLFAHDAGGFGTSGTDNVISCGSYTGNSGSGNFVSLGYEPQWVLIKNISAVTDWSLYDNMRGVPTGNEDKILFPNTSGAEESTGANNDIDFNATGFTLQRSTSRLNTSGNTYIYIAIRRPMKPPTTGTSVFNLGFRGTTEANSNNVYVYSGFPVDFSIQLERLGSNSAVTDRHRGSQWLVTQNTGAEFSILNPFDSNSGWIRGTTSSNTNYINYMFRRAPGFFDSCVYTGTGTYGNGFTLPLFYENNKKVELLIVKGLGETSDWWACFENDEWSPLGMRLNTTAACTNEFSYTSPCYQLANGAFYPLNRGGSYPPLNSSGFKYVAYGFGTVAGVSKVGAYTGTGTTQQINCGFSGGARFVLIKRTDSTGDWYVWDTARGIVSGNDPYLRLNSTAVENTSTDYIDPYSAGFEISSTAPAAINASGGTYIYLAIA